MEFILTVLSALFIIILLATAATFGFALLAFLFCVGLVTLFLLYGRAIWYRWRFLNREKHQGDVKKTSITVIETEYEDISNKK